MSSSIEVIASFPKRSGFVPIVWPAKVPHHTTRKFILVNSGPTKRAGVPDNILGVAVEEPIEGQF